MYQKCSFKHTKQQKWNPALWSHRTVFLAPVYNPLKFFTQFNMATQTKHVYLSIVKLRTIIQVSIFFLQLYPRSGMLIKERLFRRETVTYL